MTFGGLARWLVVVDLRAFTGWHSHAFPRCWLPVGSPRYVLPLVAVGPHTLQPRLHDGFDGWFNPVVVTFVTFDYGYRYPVYDFGLPRWTVTPHLIRCNIPTLILRYVYVYVPRVVGCVVVVRLIYAFLCQRLRWTLVDPCLFTVTATRWTDSRCSWIR